MGMPTYGGYGTTRPPARTYQEQDEYNARDLYGQQGQQTLQDQTNARATAGTYRSAADKALADYSGGGSPATAALKPLNLQGYSPTQVAQWQAAATGAAGMLAGKTSAAAGLGSRELTNYKSNALTAFDPSDVSNFDPTSFGETFAHGAAGEFGTQLNEKLHALENAGAGTGRLKTGFYTRDQGDVATRVGSDLNSKLAEAATTFSVQRLGALESGAGMRLSRAQGIDANMLARAQGIDANMLRGAEDVDQFGIAQGNQGLEGARLGLEGAEYMDTQNFSRANALDRFGQENAQFLDTQGQARQTNALNANLSREGMYQSAAERAADQANSFVSGNREWASADREAQDQRDVYAAQRAELERRKGTSYGTPYRDPNAASRQSSWYNFYG